jgi:hypothetical protein
MMDVIGARRAEAQAKKEEKDAFQLEMEGARGAFDVGALGATAGGILGNMILPGAGGYAGTVIGGLAGTGVGSLLEARKRQGIAKRYGKDIGFGEAYRLRPPDVGETVQLGGSMLSAAGLSAGALAGREAKQQIMKRAMAGSAEAGGGIAAPGMALPAQTELGSLGMGAVPNDPAAMAEYLRMYRELYGGDTPGRGWYGRDWGFGTSPSALVQDPVGGMGTASRGWWY